MALRYQSPEAFAEAVLLSLKEDERTLKWLSRQSGIDYSVLRSQILHKPARLTYINAVRIAEIVPLPVAA